MDKFIILFMVFYDSSSGYGSINMFLNHAMYLFVTSIWLLFLFYYLVCEAIGTAATPGLLCQPRVIVKMIVDKQMECRLAGETELLRENLPQCHFCPSQNPTWPDPVLNLGRRGGKLATNHLSYSAATSIWCTIFNFLLYRIDLLEIFR
jgi:hypothetical protein